ncbi:MAG: LytTR family transcriptional regulator [Tannerella sp.]|jgi:DNA-binding LytR/AlgR family response regulator|nr:LytTR family transcriptional regulator [Tannerella sp.]
MDKYLMIKTRDELLRINIENILYFEADRNYTKLLLSQGIMFTFAVNIGKVEEMLAKQLTEPNTSLLRVGKSFIVNKKHILQINLPKQRLLLLASEGKPRELTVPKEPLRALKDTLEAEVASGGENTDNIKEVKPKKRG